MSDLNIVPMRGARGSSPSTDVSIADELALEIERERVLSAASDGPDRLVWAGEGPVFNRASLDALFVWAFRLGASDIRIQTNRPVFVQMHGRLRPVTSRTLTDMEVEETVNRLYGADGAARLKGGEDFDVSYELLPDRRTRMRFRVNATAVLSRGDDGGAVVARTLPTRAPALVDLGIEPQILAAFRPGDGIVIVAGGTGNGKSTLLAAMTRAMLEDPDSNRAILEYSAPIEFVFDDIEGVSAPSSSRRSRDISRASRQASATPCGARLAPSSSASAVTTKPSPQPSMPPLPSTRFTLPSTPTALPTRCSGSSASVRTASAARSPSRSRNRCA